MRIGRSTAVFTGIAVALSLAPVSAADPTSGSPDAVGVPEPSVRTPDERVPAPDSPGRQPSHARQPRATDPAPAGDLPGQPDNDVIEDVPVNPDDASIPLNLTPYHDIPPALRALQQSDRISVEIIGESTQGRDLHLVVATSPMTDAEWDEWQRLSDLRTEDPQAALAAFEAGEYDDWKSPLLVNNNIHGNEWEGTDASLQVLDRLAFSSDQEVVELLDQHVVAFVVTNNPDGRVAGTRRNGNGFDINRDYITQSQPESRAVHDQIIRYDPLTMLDMHGYTGTTLIEPTTGPHGENYEYDLYIRNALRNGLAMEEAVLALDEPRVDAVNIPYRNQTSGWDDWPPIFTPMYAMYHGVVGHTVEIPLNPRGIEDEAERHERTRINTAVARAAIEANFAWAHRNRMSLLADQLEMFRRGEAGESSRPIDDELALDLAAGDNAKTFQQDYPRAYVIPGGTGRRGDPQSARLVRFLLDNDVEVHQARRPFRAGGERYPAGAYVVDMHQAKRGLANTILDVGRDVTTNFPTMYDISAWSHGELWGADVQRVSDGALETRALDLVTQAAPTGWVAPGQPPFYAFDTGSLAGVQAANHLLDADVRTVRLDDGRFAVPGSAREHVTEAADTFGVAFSALGRGEARDAERVDDVRLGAAAGADETFTLDRMGFDPATVTDAGFNTGEHAFDDFDALYVSSGTFDVDDLNETQRAAFDAWLADGGVVVGRGGAGTALNGDAGLLDVAVEEARRDANGIVAVENDPDSPVTGDDTLPTSFVSSPLYFTSVGDDVRVDQRLRDEDFFLAGHWVGQDQAAGAPVVVSGEARGADVTLFGTEPLYRSHPEGLFSQVANALWWNG
ncbi:zinc carboxypeptidase [Haloactinopolyspora alba]|uniref:Zinc carboxypeptidase n=1 Tax=Haloactinopolyspora alba TaxID=648780 RepID=A0A2P8E9K7_9ACTN|nr:M14 family zinc carboxypeptidase [Haloactinopolyspora alba]PSL06134.1 zinc carboxypeptidase [Haloactinopolyspora alba]